LELLREDLRTLASVIQLGSATFNRSIISICFVWRITSRRTIAYNGNVAPEFDILNTISFTNKKRILGANFGRN
jgi:hypothetical protein